MCAPSDYHHATIGARTEDELCHALNIAQKKQKEFPFEKYLYWFLGIHMLEPDKNVVVASTDDDVMELFER